MRRIIGYFLGLASLFVSAGNSCALGQDISGDIVAIRAAAQKAYAARSYDRAIELALQHERLRPDDPVMQFNLACLYALTGRSVLAGEYILRSAKNGFDDIDRATSDPDLISIQLDPDYREAIQIINNAEDRFRKLVRANPPIVILPPNHDKEKSSPVIIALHGYSGRAEGVAEAWREAVGKIGAILVAPRAVLPATPHGFDWRSLDGAEYIVKRAIRETMKTHNIDEQRVILTGFSQGGYMAFGLGVRLRNKFRGVIPMAALYDPVVASLGRKLKQEFPRYYIICGSLDPVVVTNEQAHSDYLTLGMPVKLKIFSGLGHAFPKNRTEELMKALDFVLKK